MIREVNHVMSMLVGSYEQGNKAELSPLVTTSSRRDNEEGRNVLKKKAKMKVQRDSPHPRAKSSSKSDSDNESSLDLLTRKETVVLNLLNLKEV